MGTTGTIAVTALLLGGGPGGPLPHAVAFVNDSRSHGAVGDALLSLNEAILLHNGQLATSQLSAAELAQLSLIPGTGTTTDVTWIDIDGGNTPVITIQQDLAPVLDTSFGLLIKGFGDPPVLDFTGPGLAHGLRAPCNSISVQDVVFRGGPYGLDVVQTDVSGQAGATLHGVRFEDQAQFGVRVTATTPNGVGRVILERCTFVNCPLAVRHDESGPNRIGIFELHEVDVDAAATGIDVVLGAGGSTRCTFDRVTIAASVRGLRVARAAGADRQVFLEGAFVRVRAADCALVQCHPTAATWLLAHLWDLRAPPGGSALQLGAPGDALFGELTEATLEGAVAIGAGAGAQPLALSNLRCRNGAVVLGASAALPLVLGQCRFDGCAVTTAGTGPVYANGCCFVGGSLAGTNPAPLVLAHSYAPAPGPLVQVAQPLPAPQLGSMAIVPEDVAVGSTVQFVVDLPPGLLGVFALGLTDPSPTLLGAPLQLYVDPTAYAILPGVYVLQQAYAWSVPASAVFVGTDLTVQLAVLATAGVLAPWLQLPPGRRFVLR